MNILLLGAGGNAGRNFTKCLRMTPEDGAPPRHKIVGVDLNPYYLRASGVDLPIHLNAQLSEGGKLALLLDLVASHEIDFIHAQPDPEVEFLARHQARFAGRLVPLNPAVLALCRDKEKCQQWWAAQLGLKFVALPVAEALKDDDAFEYLLRDTGKAWVRARTGAGARAALPVTTPAQCLAWVDYWVAARGMCEEDFTVSPWLPGPEYAVQTLWWHGELIHMAARERVIHFFANLSPSGQTSTPSVARTVRNDDVSNRAVAAIRVVAEAAASVPHGIYCVDLRQSAPGELVPTEINYGRFFTTMDFFASMGMNSPSALLDLHRGRTVPPSIDELPADVYWIRGLDQTPVMMPHILPST